MRLDGIEPGLTPRAPQTRATEPVRISTPPIAPAPETSNDGTAGADSARVAARARGTVPERWREGDPKVRERVKLLESAFATALRGDVHLSLRPVPQPPEPITSSVDDALSSLAQDDPRRAAGRALLNAAGSVEIPSIPPPDEFEASGLVTTADGSVVLLRVRLDLGGAIVLPVTATEAPLPPAAQTSGAVDVTI